MKQVLRHPQLGHQTVKSDPNGLSTPSQKVRNNPSTRNPVSRSGLNRWREGRLLLGGSLSSGRLAFCRCLGPSRMGIPKPGPIKTKTANRQCTSPHQRPHGERPAHRSGIPAPAISNQPTFPTRVRNI